MDFKIKAGGIDIILRIDNYESPEKHEFGKHWCHCDFSFCLENIINYQKIHEEILLPEEVDYLANTLTELLEDKLNSPQEVKMMEPDFVFMLYPKEDLRKDPTHLYVHPDYVIRDVYVEWRIYFWNEGLTRNYLTITLQRKNIAALRDFLLACKAEGIP